MEVDPASNRFSPNTVLSTASVEGEHNPPYTLLIADDNATARMLLCLAFKTEPYLVYEAADGKTALALYLDHAPNLILLDIALPKMDGITVLQQIRQVNQTVRILMVSGMNVRKWRHVALAYGANGFVAKPFNLVAVRQMVAQQLREGRE